MTQSADRGLLGTHEAIVPDVLAGVPLGCESQSLGWVMST